MFTHLKEIFISICSRAYCYSDISLSQVLRVDKSRQAIYNLCAYFKSDIDPLHSAVEDKS